MRLRNGGDFGSSGSTLSNMHRWLAVPLLLFLSVTLLLPLTRLMPDLAQAGIHQSSWSAFVAVSKYSVTLATVAATVSTVTALCGALVLRRLSTRIVLLIISIIALPVTVQLTFRSFFVLTALARLQESFPDTRVTFSFFATVVGLSHYLLPFACLLLVPAARFIDQDLLDVARLAGARRLRVMVEVLLPLMFPAVGVCFALSFSLAYGAYVTPALLGGIGDITVSRYVATLLGEGRAPQAALFALGGVAIPVTLFLIALLLVRRGGKQIARVA